MDTTFTFKRRFGKHTHLPRTKSYPLVYGSSEDHIVNMEIIRDHIKKWIEYENQLKDDKIDSKHHITTIIRDKDLKVLANPNKIEKRMLPFVDAGGSASTSRILDLCTKIEFSFPHEYISSIKGRIYKSVTEYGTGIAGTASNEDWYVFTEQYSFIWILFLIQDVLREAD